MSSVRELAAESIGRMTRRQLEPQLAQAEGALEPGEAALAVGNGTDGRAAVLVVVTDRRVLTSSGAAFARPELGAVERGAITGAEAAAESGAWALRIAHAGGELAIAGMHDRDAIRLAAVLGN